MNDNTPYQKFIDLKHFEVKLKSYTDNKNSSHNYKRTFFTTKGLQYIEKLYKKTH